MGLHTVAVTGASGHIGANVIRELVARGRAVRALVHEDRLAIDGVDCEVVAADLRDTDSLRRAFDGAETVYHLAGHISILMTDWERTEAINVGGTRNVVQACLDAGVRRLVHFSSIQSMQQQPLDEVLDESRPLVTSAKAPPYDRSKAAGELEVLRGLERGLDAVILNPTCVVGPHDYRPSLFGQALISIVRGELPALVRGGFDWVDARDVALCAVRAEELAPAGAKYIVGGHWKTVRDLGHIAGRLRSVSVPWFVCPLGIVQAAAPLAVAWARLRGQRATFTSVMARSLQGNRHISSDKARRELGYEPRALEATLEDTLSWFAARGLIEPRA
ncbi:MAG: NAD-dependent epimerase/dehydratase family protein [Chloroflexi bacterium]|nr:NAD-dependent epimerase/dehydratase family protein [Chloroflexota bacterium]